MRNYYTLFLNYGSKKLSVIPKKSPSRVNLSHLTPRTDKPLEMIISDEPRIFEILEKYEQNTDEHKLKENIIEIVRPKRKSLFNFFFTGLFLYMRNI